LNSTFKEKKYPDEDPARSKDGANVHNKMNDNTITMVIYYEFLVLTVVVPQPIKFIVTMISRLRVPWCRIGIFRK
jgi:hypothetical protein